MKFVLATHNPNKIREMGAILGQFGVEVVSPKDCLLYTSPSPRDA